MYIPPLFLLCRHGGASCVVTSRAFNSRTGRVLLVRLKIPGDVCLIRTRAFDCRFLRHPKESDGRFHRRRRLISV